ncbi:hypothetical protein PF011_g24381, partial [Phytophthora fragariae]
NTQATASSSCFGCDVH